VAVLISHTEIRESDTERAREWQRDGSGRGTGIEYLAVVSTIYDAACVTSGRRASCNRVYIQTAV
jgi:hypothetical protein